MQTAPQVSWLREFLFPALFVLLGAVLTYLVAQLNEGMKAK